MDRRGADSSKVELGEEKAKERGKGPCWDDGEAEEGLSTGPADRANLNGLTFWIKGPLVPM